MVRKNWDQVAAKEYREMHDAYASDANQPDDWADLRAKVSN